jgi:hypothetical protein
MPENWKLIVMAVVAAYVILNDYVPVIWNKLFKKETTVLTANDVTNAYRLLEPYLNAETAKAVRLQVAEGFLPTPIATVIPETKSAEKNTSDVINKLINSLDKLVDSQKVTVPPIEAKT